MEQFRLGMDILQILVWPAVAVIALLIFREPLTAFLTGREDSSQGPEEKFREPLAELLRKAENLPDLPSLPPLEELSGDEERLFRLAEVSKRSAIFDAWLAAETAAREMEKRRGPEAASTLAGRQIRIGDALFLADLVDQTQFEIFNQLRKLRDAAQHFQEAEVSRHDVAEYVRLALRFARFLRAAPKAGQGKISLLSKPVRSA